MAKRIHELTAWAGWTDENVALLRKLSAEGLSCAQIAKTIGAPSRNSVIAKRHRIGLSLPREQAQAQAKRRAQTRAQARPVRRALRLAGNGTVFEAAQARQPICSITLEESDGGLRIIDPGFTGCKWPIGGEGVNTRFCCTKAEVGPYCTTHARIAYRPQPAKKRSVAEATHALRRFA